MILVEILIPLIATVLIELGVLRLLGEKSRRVLWSSVVVNILTNVPLNVWAHWVSGPGWGDILIAEAVVIVVETLWYYYFVRSLKQAFVYAFLCNAISFLAGLLFIFAIFS
jgi:hypothetical protein